MNKENDTVLHLCSPVEAILDELPEWFPAVLRDESMLWDELRSFLTNESPGAETHRFGMEWLGRPDAIRLLRMEGVGALVPNVPLSCNFDTAEHVIVVGENLEVMKLLQKAYFGKFKAIYFDPPYNLGNDLVWADDYDNPLRRYLEYSGQTKPRQIIEASTDRGGPHSRWLTMMLPRLFAARNLLADNGVIFVSLDDHEIHHLRLLMDEVFGSENLVCNFIWEKRYAVPPDTGDVGYVHENILCYRRSDAFEAALLPMTEAQKRRYKNRDDDKRGSWKPQDYTCRFSARERPNLYYPVINPNTGEEVWPKKTRVWACTREEHAKNIEDKRVWWPEGATVPAKKKFIWEIRQGGVPTTLLTHKMVGHTDEATKELREWYPDLKATPKPTRLIRYLLEFANLQTGDLVLDSFSGTGTTAEAAARANSEGREFRSFMIQLPEPVSDESDKTWADISIGRSIGAVKKLEGADGGVRVFHLKQSGFKNWQGEKARTSQQLKKHLKDSVLNVDPSRTEMDLLYEILLKAGFPLTAKINVLDCAGPKVYSVDEGLLLICLGRPLDPDVLRYMISLEPAKVICLDANFEGNDELKTNIVLEMRSHNIEFRTV